LPSGIGYVRITAFAKGAETPMRRVSFLTVFALTYAWLAGVGFASQNPGGNPDAKKMKNPVASSPASIKAGQAAFQKNCRLLLGLCSTPGVSGQD
jgi:hypothetical protein